MHKFIYPFTLVSTISQFLIIYYASLISIYQVGIFSLLNSIFIIIISSARFDGAFLYISKLISREDLENWSKNANGIVTILFTITNLILINNLNFIALSLITLNFLNLYIGWSIDLKNPEKRLISGYNYIYKKDILINQIFFRFTLQIALLIIFLNSEKLSYETFNLYLKLIIFLEFIILYSISFYKIGIKINFKKNGFPPAKYFMNILLRKGEESMLNLSIAFISGINTLGSIQLGLSFSRILKLFINQLLRFEYVNLYSKKFLKKILNLSLLSYLLYLLFPVVLILINRNFNFINYKIDTLIFILLCIYSGNRNSKNIIQHLGIVFKEINIVIKFSINLILINFFISFIIMILKNYFILSLSQILFILISADTIYTLSKLLNNYKLKNSS